MHPYDPLNPQNPFDPQPYDGCSDGEQPKPFPLISALDFAVLINQGWHIKGILPKAELIVLFGEPGSGKTFATLDMVMAIARGTPWLDHKVKQGRVIYICAEGQAGFRGRLIAYAEHYHVDLKELTNLSIITDVPNLLTEEHTNLLASSIVQADLIVIDTFSRTMPGGDENTSTSMGAAIAQCQSLHNLTGATVMLIHHCGKDETKGTRGWSGLKGAADTEIKVEDLSTVHQITVTKQKDGESGVSLAFRLEKTVIGTDEDGDDITSCYLVPSEAPKIVTKDKSLGPNEQIALNAFKAIKQGVVSTESLIDRAVQGMPYDPNSTRDRRRDVIVRAIASLAEKKILSVVNNSVSLL